MIRLLAGLPSDRPPHHDGVTWWGLAAVALLALAVSVWLLAHGRRRGHHHKRRNDKENGS